MDPNQYHFTYISGNAAHQAAAPLPITAAPPNIVYLRRTNGAMLPIHHHNGGFLPASSRIPHWTTAHQAEQRMAAEQKIQEAARKKREADEARKAVCVIKQRHSLTEGSLMVQASAFWARDPTTGQQRPVIPKGADVPVPGYVYAYHHGNGDYRYYK
jgi:hypothetical protein